MFSNSLQTYDVKLAEGKLQSVKNRTIHFDDFSFDDGVHRLLEFKFESENLLFFCTQMFCRLENLSIIYRLIEGLCKGLVIRKKDVVETFSPLNIRNIQALIEHCSPVNHTNLEVNILKEYAI